VVRVVEHVSSSSLLLTCFHRSFISHYAIDYKIIGLFMHDPHVCMMFLFVLAESDWVNKT